MDAFNFENDDRLLHSKDEKTIIYCGENEF